jgi:hypothetical protein
MLTGDAAIHAAAPVNTTQAMTSRALRGPGALSFVLIPAKKSATANSTTPST